MADTKKQMVTAVFRDRLNAERAFDMLHTRGYTDAEINVLMSDKTRSTYYSGKNESKLAAGTHAEEGAGVGGAIGTAVGATLAAVVMIGSSIAIPGLGLVIAGPLAGALMGAGAGAVTGGLVGALVGWGIPEDNAQAFHEALNNGGVVIGVHPRNNDDASKIEKEFKNLQGENVIRCSC